MDRFRELVSRLNLGEVTGSRATSPSPQPTAERSERTAQILEQLPVTRAFVESLPRNKVIAKSEENNAKAVEATDLMHRVDELVRSHVAAARDLRKYVDELNTIHTRAASAQEHAYSIYQQLLELDRELNQAESAITKAELDHLQQVEDAQFEAYAKAKRAELQRKKQEYAENLMSFQKDRYIVSQDFTPHTPRSPLGVPTRASSTTSISTVSSRGTETGRDLSSMGIEEEGHAGRDALSQFLGSESSTSSGIRRQVKRQSGASSATDRVASSPPVVTGRKLGKGPVITAGGAKLAAKAAPVRPKIDILADEDFLD